MFQYVFVSQVVNINLAFTFWCEMVGGDLSGQRSLQIIMTIPQGRNSFVSPGAALLWVGSVTRAQIPMHISASVAHLVHNTSCNFSAL